jgi:hypothetical protein
VVEEDCTVNVASWVAHLIGLVDQVELQAEITVGLVAGAAQRLLGRERKVCESEKRGTRARASLTNPSGQVLCMPYLDFQQERGRKAWWPVRAR